MTISTPFRSHNILLPDGRETLPGHPLAASSAACVATLRELCRAFPGDRSEVTVADLGSLEGGYAAAFARAGFRVTGIEAREDSHDCAALLPSALGLPNLDFICEDVRNIQDMRFDVVFCSGLLYHMDQPVSFIKMLGTVTQRMLILNTHCSLPGGHPESAHHPGSYCDYSDSQSEGRSGHRYYESDTRWDSYGNTTSFWLTREDLMITLREDAGFTEICEITDWRHLGDPRHIHGGANTAYADRLMFTAVKP